MDITVLYTFTGGFDGGTPNGNLVMDSRGAIYGTTQSGAWTNEGLVSKLTPPAAGSTQWQQTVLHYFHFDPWDHLPGDGTTPFRA